VAIAAIEHLQAAGIGDDASLALRLSSKSRSAPYRRRALFGSDMAGISRIY